MSNRAARFSSLVLSMAVACAMLVPSGPLWAQKSGAPPKPKPQTLTGFIGDSTCGLKHMSGGAKKCTVRCVNTMGAKYALLSNGKIYTLEGQESELEKVAGEHAKVTGTLQGTTMKVSSVVSAKFEEAPDMD